MSTGCHLGALFVLIVIAVGEVNATCVTPAGSTGKCVQLKQCSNLFAMRQLSGTLSPNAESVLKKAECSLEGSQTEKGVCCQPERIFELPGNCGLTVYDRIAGGNKTAVFEFPWMALLMFRDFNENELSGNCGGSLISDQYVLTAAHCLVENDHSKLEYVRLGEHTISKREDCNNFTDSYGVVELDCAEPVENVPIASYIIHPQYLKAFQGNDIGLVRLAEKITFKDHIKPICLPMTAELKDRDLPEYYVSGWGLTEDNEKSNVLMKAKLPLLERAKCQKLIDDSSRNRQKIQISEKQICAGGRNLVDSCQGDSGGPLMWLVQYHNRTRYVQFGLVSYGVEYCGKINFPGIYTRIGSYLGWILANMKA